MKISFQKKIGDPSLGILFFWKMSVVTRSPMTIAEHFIPEPFFDYLFIQKGRVYCVADEAEGKFVLPRQSLRTLHTRPVKLSFSTPLVLFGARFALGFAESFSGEIQANCFLKQDWVKRDARDLESFASQVTEYVHAQRSPKSPYPMLLPNFEESDWLVNFSARHKRRLYQAVFGLSRKELQNIRNVHVFLEQACDFSSRNPRIIEHVTPDVFYDQPHLNHSFKKMTGLAPVEYFQNSSILQDNLMSASYNEVLPAVNKIGV